MKFLYYIPIIIVLHSFLYINLYARENPFKKVDTRKSVFKKGAKSYLNDSTFRLPDEAREISEIIVRYKSISGEQVSTIIKINKKIDWRIPISLSQKEVRRTKLKKQSSLEFVPFSFIKYKVSDDSVFIYTSATNIRNFMLPNPNKIVMDFSYDNYFKTYKKKIDKNYKVSSITTGSHKGFFRVAIVLIGKYKYKITKVNNGYKVTFE